jgi:hypothetical protein
VAERDEIARALAALDAGDPRDGQHIALGQPPRKDAREQLLAEQDAHLGLGSAPRDGLLAHIDHAGAAVLIEVTELGGRVGIIRSRRAWAHGDSGRAVFRRRDRDRMNRGMDGKDKRDGDARKS